jgi:hypothetical protein
MSLRAPNLKWQVGEAIPNFTGDCSPALHRTSAVQVSVEDRRLATTSSSINSKLGTLLNIIESAIFRLTKSFGIKSRNDNRHRKNDFLLIWVISLPPYFEVEFKIV